MNKGIENNKNLFIHVFAIIVFALITLLYCFPIINEEKINQSDYKQFLGMSQEIIDHRESTGEEALWTNSMFGGMPAYQISVHYPNNILVHVDRFFQLFLPRPVGIMFLYFLGFYIFMLCLKIDPYISFLGAIAFGMSSYFFIILEAGHNTKAHALAYLAPSVASMIYCFKNRNVNIWGNLMAFFFTFLCLGLHLRANHLQISYYLLFILFAFWVYYFLYAMNKSSKRHFLQSTLIFSCAGLMAIAINLGNIWSTYEYSKYTIRGDSELVQDTGVKKSGLDKEYATAWSYGPLETFNLLYPNFMGGSSHSRLSNNSNLYKVLKSNRIPEKQSLQFIKAAPTYFGPQSFTSGPVYIGSVVWLLFFISLFVVKKPIKWVFCSLIIFSFMLSWGKYFPLITNFFLDYFPLYNKFRTVSMILIIAQFAIPALAFLGLSRFINSDISKQIKKKILLYAFLILISISVFFLLFKHLLFNFTSPFDAQYQVQWLVDALISERISLFNIDIIRSVVFICLSSALLYYIIETGSKLKRLFVFGLFCLILIDMWGVNKRYLNADDFVKKSEVEKPFKMESFDRTIQEDNSIYRVYNLNERIDQGARTSYFHHSLGGYHGAKLGKYQDVIDNHIMKGNFEVINMLNTKYVISNKNGQAVVQKNSSALGNAWLVDSIYWVNSANEELASLDIINPKSIVSINKKHQPQIGSISSSDGTIELVSYQPNKLVYKSNSDSVSFAVFSEIFYPKGWKAYIDGEYVNHFSVNYILRGLVIPSGSHDIIFEFKPKSFFASAKIAFGASCLLVLTAIISFVGFFVFKK